MRWVWVIVRTVFYPFWRADMDEQYRFGVLDGEGALETPEVGHGA